MTKNNAAVIVSASTKGGTTKTSTIANLGAYLALQHKHVLFIDTDYQSDLTSCMNKVGKADLKRSCIIRAYQHDAENAQAPFPKDFEPAYINKYVDLIASNPQVANVSNLMRNHISFAPYVMLHMFNTLHLSEKYDYILIDCHNSFNLLTKGAMVVADYVLTPIIPGRFSIKSITTMVKGLRELKTHLISPISQKSFITAKLYFIGNMIDKSTKSGQQLAQIVHEDPQFIAGFHRRELVNRATTNYASVFAQARKDGLRAKRIVVNEIDPQFKKIVKEIGKE